MYGGEECVMCVMLCEDRRESCMWKSKGWENKIKKVRKKQPRECVEKEKKKLFYKINSYHMFDFLKVIRMKILFKFLTQEPCNWNYMYYINLSKVCVMYYINLSKVCLFLRK